jgi:hypothetical protein
MIIPIFTDVYTWANSLIIDFPDENIPILYNDTEWKDWGNQVSRLDSFLEAAAPGTELYDTWQTWADEVYHAMADF